MAESRPNPRVGVAAIIQNADGKVVLGKRKASHGAGQWAFPGGHLEYGESVYECAEREVLEETGMGVMATSLTGVTNNVFHDVNKHYITLFVKCEMLNPSTQPELREPDKCEGWFWKSWDEIRQIPKEELFLPVVNFLIEFPNEAKSS
ncbi:hypothetical protein NKR23_g9688 [Pleurostoma richardsiae]|uniref:Nudix hydrolase domain-containing protein n=1 Tax=Pleurostoma richardsiae TaxID=41990 RepID=A0AA38R6F1_9PEZI|nr:hypothetical protein NKR23_g9688 [Pleurostoma richardsiae]